MQILHYNVICTRVFIYLLHNWSSLKHPSEQRIKKNSRKIRSCHRNLWVRCALKTNTSIELNINTWYYFSIKNLLLDLKKEYGDGTSCFKHQNIPHKTTISKFCDKNCLLFLIEPQIQPTWDFYVGKPKLILKNSLNKTYTTFILLLTILKQKL